MKTAVLEKKKNVLKKSWKCLEIWVSKMGGHPAMGVWKFQLFGFTSYNYAKFNCSCFVSELALGKNDLPRPPFKSLTLQKHFSPINNSSIVALLSVHSFVLAIYQSGCKFMEKYCPKVFQANFTNFSNHEIWRFCEFLLFLAKFRSL